MAMSKEVCNAFTLYYDLTVWLNMVLVNGSIDQLLGLAHNVPFSIGNITIYLQVHILCILAYNILLGQPFNILTQSIICNYADKNQIITIINPNTSQKATVPTVPHGSVKFIDHCIKKQDF
jgi:hypothetical protein